MANMKPILYNLFLLKHLLTFSGIKAGIEGSIAASQLKGTWFRLELG